MLFRLDLVPGSEHSLMFHNTLDKSADPKVFTAQAIDHIISYKWQTIKYYGYLYVTYYMIYMGCIVTMRWGGWRMVRWWFLLHFVEECMQLFLSIEGFWQFVKEVWNAFDFMRLIAMLVFIYMDFNYEEMDG